MDKGNGQKILCGFPPGVTELVECPENLLEAVTIRFTKGAARMRVELIPAAKDSPLGNVLQTHDVLLVERETEKGNIITLDRHVR